MITAVKKNKLFKFFASLKLAVISILTLAGVLATATILESYYGMRAAHVMIYGTWWFAGVLGLLGLNVTCAALSRYPWKKSQTGFVITHAGIILMLVGSFITQRWGVDGTLPVEETKENNEVALGDLALAFYNEGGTLQAEIPLPETGRAAKGELLDLKIGSHERLMVDQFLPRVVTEKNVLASPMAGVGTPAIKVDLLSSRFNVSEWLFASAPEKPTELNLGPAILSFKRLWDSADDAAFLADEGTRQKNSSSAGYVSVRSNGREYRVRIEDGLKKWVAFGDGLSLKVDRYLPFAIVKGTELISRNDDPVNPAVQLFVRDASGFQEKHTLFSNYPEFNTLHRSRESANRTLGLKMVLISTATPKSQEALSIVGRNRGRLEFAISSDGKSVFYRSFGKEGDLKGKGTAVVGTEIPTGWMDSKFRIAEWIPSAIQEEKPHYIDEISGGDGNYLTGLHLVRLASREPSSMDDSTPGKWLVEGSVDSIPIGNENWLVVLSKQKLRLPFRIHLDKFTVGNDPGTSKAATYQSKVVVQDPTSGVQQSALISMNEPLNYGGYTFYQASYQQEEGRPPISVFAVNFDPGRRVKYSGAIVMVLGILLMFYMNPHYWDKVLGRKRT